MATNRFRISIYLAVYYSFVVYDTSVASSDSVFLNCFSERFNSAATWNVSIDGQEELDSFVDNLTSSTQNSSSNSRELIERCIEVSLTGTSYRLDVIKLMKVKLGVGGGLVVQAATNRSRVKINCVASSVSTSLEELESALKPLSNVSLVVLDGLIFTGCPVPVLFEEISTVIVQNCDFM